MRKNTADYQRFVDTLKEEIRHLVTDEDMSVVFQKASDEDSEDYLMVELAGDAGRHIQRFHTEELFRNFKSGMADMETILEKVSETLGLCKEIEKLSPLEEIDHYEKICSRLCIRPMNYDKHTDQLRMGIYDVVGDIALVLYIFIGNVKRKYVSSMVPTRIFSVWGKSKKTVLEAALKNTFDLFPPRMLDLSRIIGMEDDIYSKFMEMKELPKEVDRNVGIFITNTAQINGAVSVFLPGVAQKLGELLGNDYYLAFTSIHEVAIHDMGFVDVEGIRSSLHELNAELDMEEDFLTEQVYKYSREDDKIEMIECIPGHKL